MKRIRIALIIMLVFVAAAVAVFFTVQHFNDQKAEESAKESAKLVIFDFDENASTSLKIHNDGGTYEMNYDSSDGWIMNGEVDFEVNSNTAVNICTAMASLTAQKIIEDPDKEKFGFDNPIDITVTADGKDYTLHIGNAAPTNESYYVMKEGSDNIYLIGYNEGSVLRANKESLKSLYIADFNPNEVERFALWKGEENDDNILFSMKRDKDGNWSMDKPFKDNSVFASDISTFINDAIRDKIYKFVAENCPESDYAKYGFDKPQYVYEIASADKYIKVIFGNMTSNDTEMYGLFTETGQVVTFYKNTVAALGYGTEDMMDNTVYSVTADELTGVTVTMPDGTAEVEIDSANDKYTFNGKEISSSNEGLFAAYFDFLNSFNDAYFESVDRNAEPEGEPEVTVRYALANGSETVIEYIPVPGEDSNTYWAMKNGEYTGFVVRKKVVANISSSCETLKELLK